MVPRLVEASLLPDLLAPNLRLVICGTAAGTVSAVRKAYYAGPGNRFWTVLHQVGLTPRQLRPEQYRELLKFRIGLTDVAKQQSGSDADLDFRRSDPATTYQKILEYQPSVLAFNGKKAAQVFLGRRKVEFGLQSDRIDQTLLFVAPSTSGAAGRYWDIDHWHELSRFTGKLERH